ncbi:MAG: phytoene desaturase family protein [Dehalococcoidia bacterium]
MALPEQTTVAVIGGGLAGLTAAAYLARDGVGVALIERAPQAGGRAITVEKSGFKLNLGPHALYRDSPAPAILAELGVAVPGRSPEVKGVALKGGRRHILPSSATALFRTGVLSAREKVVVSAFLAGLGRMDFSAIASEPLDVWLRRRFESEGARSLVAALVRLATYANAPEVASAGAAMAQLRSALRGVTYIEGGWQTLVDGLRGRAEAAGVRFVRGRASRVGMPSPRRRVEIAGGAAIEAEAVIIAASPADAATLLTGAEHEAPAMWAAQAVPARASCLDIALTRLPRRRPLFALGVDEATYLSVHSAYAKLAPSGATLVSLAKYLRPDEHDPGAALRELEATMDLVHPGWRALEVDRQFLPSLIVMHDQPRAATGGLAGRPPVAVPAAPGVFVAGDWAGPEGWLAGAALASARAAAAQARAHLASTRELRAAG